MSLRALLIALIISLAGTATTSAESPTATSSAEPWQLVAMPGKTGWDAIRLNTATGKTWVASQGKWKPLKEEGGIPAPGEVGTYHCVGFRSGDDTWYALRFNLKTGKTWSIDGDVWHEFAALEE